jgi:hypothetical protein
MTAAPMFVTSQDDDTGLDGEILPWVVQKAAADQRQRFVENVARLVEAGIIPPLDAETEALIGHIAKRRGVSQDRAFVDYVEAKFRTVLLTRAALIEKAGMSGTSVVPGDTKTPLRDLPDARPGTQHAYQPADDGTGTCGLCGFPADSPDHQGEADAIISKKRVSILAPPPRTNMPRLPGGRFW